MKPDRKKPSDRMKVLLIAYQCDPDGGSVAMIGWRWFAYLRERAAVHLVTHIRHQRVLTPLLRQGDQATFVDTEAFAGPLFRISSRLFGKSQHVVFMVSNLDFLVFGRKVMRLCRRLHKEQSFDVCHVPTPVSVVAPHRFGKIGPPTLLGPLNGGMTTPPGFPEIMKAERGWLFRFRFVSRFFTHLWGTYRHADIIFSATKMNDQALGAKWKDKIGRLCENGVDEVAATVPPFPDGERLELLFVGRLIPVKGLTMLLEALARLNVSTVRLRIVGDGPQAEDLRRQVERLGLADRVQFLGYQPHETLPEYYRACHLNVLPSIRDSGGATILEAMAQGRPSIALDHGGPAEYITPETGFLLPCRNTRQVTQDLTALLSDLAADRTMLTAMAEGCLKRVHAHFTWDAKIKTALNTYRELTGQRKNKATDGGRA